jgi:hypothetical protein
VASPIVARAVKRAAVRAAAAAATAKSAGADNLEVGKAALKGAVPLASPIIDRVVTPENIERVKSGVRDVIDKGRNLNFQDKDNNAR